MVTTRVALDERAVVRMAVVRMAGEWHVPRLQQSRHDLNPGERKQTWRIITRQCGILTGMCKIMSLRCRGLRCPILLSLASFLFQYVQRPFYIGVAVPGAAAVWGLLAQVPPMGAPPPRR